MATTSSFESQKVDKLLSLHKAATVVIKNNVSHKVKDGGNIVKTIACISPEKKIIKSNKVLGKSEITHNTMLLLKVKKKKEEAIVIKHENPFEEVYLINGKDGDDFPDKITIEEQTKPNAEEHLCEIYTEVIKVDPFEDEGTSNSVHEFRDENVFKPYKPTKKKPRIIIKVTPEKRKNPVRSLKEKKGQEKCTFIHNDKVNKSKTLRRSNRTKPLKVNNTIIDHKKVNNVKPIKIRSKRSIGSTQKKNLNRCHSEETPAADKPFSCTRCDKSFQYASTLKIHEVSHTGLKSFVCDHCPSRFSQQSHLNRHSIIHEKKAKRFKCGSCKMSFHRNCYLVVHSRVHSGSKPYTCGECSKSFCQKSQLNTHMKSHKEKEYECAVCSRSFTLFHHLRTHLKRVHKN